MQNIQKNIYKKIIKYVDLNQANNDPNFEFEKKLGLNKKLIIRLNQQKNEFFTLCDFIFINKKLTNYKKYTEFTVRIWNNQQAGVIKYKKAELSEYQDIYIVKHGFEETNKELQDEANNAFLNCL